MRPAISSLWRATYAFVATRLARGHAPTDNPWAVLAIVIAGAFMLLVDVSIVNVAIPSIRRALNASTGQIQLIAAGYQIAFACVLITAGRLGDIYGRRHLFLAGMAGFTVASVGAGAAPSASALIIARVCQGFLGGLMFPQVLSLIQVTFPPKLRGRAFSVFGAAIGVATALGPLLGGILIFTDIAGLGWRLVFLVNIPIGMVALFAAWRWLPSSRSDDRPRLDLPGVVLITVALFLLIFPITEGRSEGWPFYMLALLAGSFVLLMVFAALERRRTQHNDSPLVPTTLFKDRAFCAGLALIFIFVMGLPAFFFTFSIFLQAGCGYSALATGLVQFSFAVGSGTASWHSDRMARWLGVSVLNVGAGMITVGMTGLLLAIHMMATELKLWVLAPLLLLAGAGLGTFIAPVINIVLLRVRVASAGAASGVFTTVQRIGGAAGVAVIGIVFFGSLSGHDAGMASQQNYSSAFQHALLYEIGVFALTFLLVFLLPRQREAD